MSSLWSLVDDAAAEARALMALGHFRGVVSRSYYAAFTAARVLLAERAGFETGDVRRHTAVHKLVSKHLVQSNLIPADLASDLRRFASKRAEADYHAERVAESEAPAALAMMERFLQAAAQLRNPSPP